MPVIKSKSKVTKKHLVVEITDEYVLFLAKKSICLVKPEKILLKDFANISRECICITIQAHFSRKLSQYGLQTISLQTLLAMIMEKKLTESEYAAIFHKKCRVNYKYLVESKSEQVFAGEKLWANLWDMVYECFRTIRRHHMENILQKEIAATPVLHRIFDRDYHLDRKAYWKWVSDTRAELLQLQEEGLQEERIRKLQVQLKQYDESKLYCTEGSDIIRCNYNQIGTKTYRICTYGNNLQGFPKGLKAGLYSEKQSLVEYDITSCQFKILAALACEDKVLVYGGDVYQWISSILFEKDMEDITREERKAGKLFLLMLMNGAGNQTLAKELNKAGVICNTRDVQRMRSKFLQEFTKISKYLDALQNADTYSVPSGMTWSGERLAEGYKRISCILQHCESELLLDLIVACEPYIMDLGGSIYLTIHDSIILEMDEDCVTEKLLEQMNTFLQESFRKQFPLCPEETIIRMEEKK